MRDPRDARWCKNCGHNELKHTGSWRCRGLVENGRHAWTECFCRMFEELDSAASLSLQGEP